MKYTRADQKRFLDLVLKSIAEKYCDVLKTRASILKDNNEIYASLFVKISEEKKNGGQLLLRFKKKNGIPRKNEYFTAVILPLEICKPKTWGDLTWGDLRKRQIEFSEVHCVWQGMEDSNGILICGFKGLSIEMEGYLTTHPGCVVILGPQEPPIIYYQNMIDLLAITIDPDLNSILDFNAVTNCWNPTPIHQDFTSDCLLSSLNENQRIIVQGPPGTGKTHRIAEIVAKLLDNNHSILVTSFTNRALIEVAEKEGLKRALEQGKISKTCLTSDENRQFPKLENVRSYPIPSIKGRLVLSTFYVSSYWAKLPTGTPPFDYVIVDEASQALFPMIAAATRLGKKIMWVGDQNQLPPVIILNEEKIIKFGYSLLVNGFSTLCDNIPLTSYILSDTFRLQDHAAKLTSLFYPTALTSRYKEIARTESCDYHLPYNRNVAYSALDFKPGDKYIEDQIDDIFKMVENVLDKSPKAKITILSKFRSTVRNLQREALYRFDSKYNILIDTVERVQGITRDVCFFVIPDYMRNMSLRKELFNVATSRASIATIIIGPHDILNTNCAGSVRNYLSSIILDNPRTN